MRVEIQLTREPIARPAALPADAGDSGAWVEFTGMVRGEEDGRPIAALEYEAYEPMAVTEMRRIAAELSSAHPCHAMRIIHRLGVVPVGEAAIYAAVAARHRAEAFALLTGFMDRLKQDVPIWKCRSLTAGELSAAKKP